MGTFMYAVTVAAHSSKNGRTDYTRGLSIRPYEAAQSNHHQSFTVAPGVFTPKINVSRPGLCCLSPIPYVLRRTGEGFDTSGGNQSFAASARALGQSGESGRSIRG